MRARSVKRARATNIRTSKAARTRRDPKEEEPASCRGWFNDARTDYRRPGS